MAMIISPWTEEQVEWLNAYQRVTDMHPFTCEYRGDHYSVNQGILVATTAGWICPSQGCDYRQMWAHEWMADSKWLNHEPWWKRYMRDV